MRTCTDHRYRHAVWLATWLMLMSCPAFTQTDVYYQAERIKEKGYWQLSTRADSRSTRILFFDRQNQLIYQETLPENYIDLTQQTVDLLDSFLARLERNRLLATELQNHLISFPAIDHRHRRRSNFEDTSLKSDASWSDIQNRVHCSVSSGGIIRLNLLNPTAEVLAIRLIDEQGRSVYFKSIKQEEFFSRLDVSNLANGYFQLSITNENGKVLYKTQLSKSTNVRFTLQNVFQANSVAFIP